MDVSNNKFMKVKARITLLKTEEGGRSGFVRGPYRPNHNFGDAENRYFYIGQIEFDENDLVYPGDTRDVVVAFIEDDNLIDKLSPGSKWRIQEAFKLVGMGEALEIIKED